MRTTKELLEVMLKNICYMEYGLCGLIGVLLRHRKITISEVDILNKYLSDELDPDSDYRYYWVEGAKQPRIDWLKQQIEKLEQTK
jgi:hypothetical protein